MNKREVKRLWREWQKAKKANYESCNALWLANRACSEAAAAKDDAETKLAVAVAKYGQVVVGGTLYFTEGGKLQTESVKTI
jgi:hypothetical protein